MPSSRFADLCVLVVDDQPFVRQMVRKLVHQLGFEDITEAEDGVEALSAISRRPPDVVVCDIQMQPMGGLHLLNRVRNAENRLLRDIPFVFLTSDGDKETVAKAMRQGADGYVLKPVNAVTLGARIEAALARHTRG